MAKPVTIFVCCRNRPIYLWACLDSLYRNTAYPHRFALLDMASEDPLVGKIIASFQRRGMFFQVTRSPRNDPQELWTSLDSLISDAGEYIAYVDGDVVVEDSDPCWLGAFIGLMQRNPRLAMVGPAIDKRDFVTWEQARMLEPDLEAGQLAGLIKLHSPERAQDLHDAEDGLAHPHNPPGRLLLLRSAALARIGFGTDGALDQKFRAAGYETGIAVDVRHRHLSLLNLFDFPEYDVVNRDAYMRAADRPRGRQNA